MKWQTTEDMPFEGGKLSREENNVKGNVLDAINERNISHGPSIEEEVITSIRIS